jgi:exosome complex exonuclease DIS3/RRP44
MFDGLISKAKCRGYDLDIDDSKRLADSLDAAVDASDPYINKLLRILSTRCMSPAQYFCSGEVKAQDWHHYGLAAPVYTHFTSPIRRYADVCVHRLLAASIGVAPLPTQFTKSNLHDLCANMNRRHRSAQLAGRASVQLHTLIFFAGDEGAKEEDAYVLDVSSTTSNDLYLTVMVPRYGIEGKVHLPVRADDPKVQFAPDKHTVSLDNGSVNIQVFDKVRVRIWVREFEDHQRELVVDLVSPTIGGAENARNKRPKPSDVHALEAPQNKKRKS